MRRILWVIPLLSAAMVAPKAYASGTSVTIGGDTTGASYPFFQYSGEYQQVYSSADFSGPLDIASISFFLGPDNPTRITGTYVLSLSATSAAVGSLSPTYSNNLGSNNTVFFDGTVSDTLTFNGTPFYYDPSQATSCWTSTLPRPVRLTRI